MRPHPGEGGDNAIDVSDGDVPPIRVYFLAFESETGCLFSSLTLQQGAKFVPSLQGCLLTVLFGTLSLVFTYLFFGQEINPSFDVFNMFTTSSNMTYCTRIC